MPDAPEQPSNNEGPATNEQALLAFLVDHDETCPSCGYNLRMLNQPSCPECGLALKLTVGSDEPFKRAWAVSLCLNAMVGGAGVFFLLINLASGGPTLNQFFEFLWFFVAIAWIPVPLVILMIRQRFCRWDSAVQNTIAGLSVLLMFVLGLSLILTF